MQSFDTSNPIFVCGPTNPEDIVRLPGTPWIVASHWNMDVNSGFPPTRYGFGPLDAIQMETHEVRRLYPSSDSAVDWDRSTYPDCPEPPKSLSSHGLNVRALGNNRFRLYVANHGGRHSVEVIDVAVEGRKLRATWRGCAVASLEQLSVWPNGVAPLPQDGFILSGFNVATWRPGRGWEKFTSYQGTQPGEKLVQGPGTGGMANGVEASRDGKWVFIADTLRHSIFRAPLDGGKPTVVELSFGPDNLKWGEDGQLYAAGAEFPKFETVADYLNMYHQPVCVTGIIAASIDPETLSVKEVVNNKDGFNGRFGATSTALQVGDQLWFGSAISDRVAILRTAA
jgi:hypothetical protein